MMNPYEIERRILALKKTLDDLIEWRKSVEKDINKVVKDIIAMEKKLATKSKTS